MAIPEELLKLKNWVAYEERTTPECESRIVLINPQTGAEAKNDDSSTWSDYQSAEERAKTLENGGVVFMFGEPGKPSGIAAINIKNCFEDRFADNFDYTIGEQLLKPYAAEIVSLMDSYTEYLKTGGVRIFFKTIKSLHELDSSIDYFKRNSALGIEICDSVYYCEVTGEGRRYSNNGDIKPVNERTEQARQVIAKYFTQADPAKTQEPEQQSENQTQEYSESQVIKTVSNAEYLDSVFEADKRDFQKYSQRKTGFANLDGEKNPQKFMILYPGLYVIGAVSSGGKTTFNLQLADNLATMGDHVLFFAFEQRRFELVSKSLARLCQPENHTPYTAYPTALDIRRGIDTPELRGAMQKYRAISQNSRIVECDFKTDINRIIDTVEDYIKQTGVKPVVFVDYLQLITSDNPKLTNTKDIVDANVRALKLLQMRHELIMFVVSSINRDNYATTIDFQSFKETGGIEFTADVVLGLQLYVIHSNKFDGAEKSNVNKKRDLLRVAKETSPRAMELVLLKNRYGMTNKAFYFEYYPQFDLFIPATLGTMKKAIENLEDSLSNKDDDNDDEF